MIKMANGSSKQVSDVKKGESIATMNGPAKVLCLMRFQNQNSRAKLCYMEGGLKITHKHPICIEDKWVYPADICQPVMTTCDAVYNLVIDQNHIALINNIPCILLGHNYTTGILKDEYLGSDKVVQDLKKMPGWQQGMISFAPGCF